MELVGVSHWQRFPWLRHAFTTRSGGCSTAYGRPDDLNLGLTREDDPAVVRQNRDRVTELLGGRLATVRQVHGTEVVVAGAEPVPADGLLTAEPGVLLGIMTADCVPVLVADTRLRVVGAFHAGWRGTAAAIVGVGVAKMQAHFGCKAEDLIAAIGPSIGPCCYQVGDEVRAAFAPDLFERDYLDLWEANRRQLLAAGVVNVTLLGECTACTRVQGQRKYFSHRAEAGLTGRSMGLIGIVHQAGESSGSVLLDRNSG